jgi:hypothetical protein
MLRNAVLLVLLVAMLPLVAQFDLGGAIGLHSRELYSRQVEGHSSATFSEMVRPDWNVGLLYREKHGRRTNLGLEFTWMRQEFNCRYFNGGLGGGTSSSTHVVLHTLNLAVLPEVRLGTWSDVVVRFGVSCGFRVAGSKSGYRNSYLQSRSQVETFDDDVPDEFGGELRAIFGLGFRVPTGANGGITIDPYVAYGFSSMLKVDPGSRSTEVGLRMGWVFRCNKQGFLPWLDKHTPMPPDGPNW